MLLPCVLPRVFSGWKRQSLYLWLLMRAPKRLVCAVNPWRLNEMLTIQQGLFPFPGDIRRSFMDNIRSAKR